VSSLRLQKINELIRQELGKLLLKEINFPKGCLVTITKVTTSADLAQAKVLLSILPDGQEEKIVASLNKKAGFFKCQLGKILVMYKPPKLIFKIDPAQEKTDHIDQLIDKIHQQG